jgi:hypothetical protein
LSQYRYTDFVLTNHAEERMALREVDRQMVEMAIKRPDERVPEDDGDTRFVRTINGRELHVVGKFLSDEHRWLVKSLWIRGEADEDNVLADRKPAPSRPQTIPRGAPASSPRNSRSTPKQSRPAGGTGSAQGNWLLMLIRLLLQFFGKKR